MRVNRFQWGWLVWVMLGLAACAAPTPAPFRPTPGADGVVLQDDFSNVQSGWDRHAGTDITTDYDNGQYLIAVETTEHDAWGLAGLDLNDMQISAEARYAGGPVNNSFGVLCRFTRSGADNNFYFFIISSDGYYAMGKVLKNAYSYLNPAKDYEALTAIPTNTEAVHKLQATCQGSRMAFIVNGAPAGEFEDNDLPHGDAGLIAGTLNEGGVKIHFDNVVVKQP
jgi:hypothetical protein